MSDPATDYLLLRDVAWAMAAAHPAGARPGEVPAEFALAEGGGGKFRLVAERWQLGGARPWAEARVVTIRGAAARIVNLMAFPARPDRHGLFAAELLAFGGRPRLAFLDIQSPGLDPAAAAALAGRLEPIAAAYADLPNDGPPPEWATHYSTGRFVFARGGEEADAARLCDAFGALFAAFLDQADCLPGTGADGSGPEAEASRSALAEYKRHHVASSPGSDFLGRLFGLDWTRRFLDEFLYR